MMRTTKSTFCLTLAFLALGVLALAQRPARAASFQRESIDWSETRYTNADKTDKPRVLIIGDSIAQGYFTPLEASLAGTVYWCRFTTSRSICDPVFFDELAIVLKQYRFSIIHFNNGTHGMGYNEPQYAEAFDKLLRVLHADSQGAQLIWASTTPVQSGNPIGPRQSRVIERNVIAADRVTREGIPIVDLYSLCINRPELYLPDTLHFTAEGQALQAAAVEAAIRTALASLPGAGTPAK